MNRKSLWISLVMLAVLMFGQAAFARDMLGATSDESDDLVWDHTYIVQSGDTLSSIADRAGTTLDELALVNGITDTSLVVTGTQLLVPDDVADSDIEDTYDSSTNDDSTIENENEVEFEDGGHHEGEHHEGEHEDSSHEDSGYDD